MVSIIIPVFNEAESIPALLNELTIIGDADYEIIFVDDGSSDLSLTVIEQSAAENPRVKCIALSRNFGHQNALMAGMQHCQGNQIILMDGDLQHPPSLIPFMLAELNKGFDLVHTRRNKTDNVGVAKKLFSGLFYSFINTISDTRIEPGVADFRAFNRKVLESILKFEERELFLRGIFSWIGFKTTSLTFNAPARQFGTTKYSFSKMVRLGLKGTTSFSFKPLRVALLVGSFISLAAFAFAVYALVSYYRGDTVPGWASMIIAIMLLGGTQLLAIGLLGEYIASLFTESKKRPLYLVSKTVNF